VKKRLFFLVIFLVFTFAFYKLIQSFSIDSSVTQKSQEGKKIKLIFAHHMPKSSSTHQAALRFATLVAQKTNGKVEIDVHPAQELGSSFKMMELTRSGDIDILITATAKMSLLVPAMEYADLPFIFPTKADAYTLLDGKVGETLLSELESVDMYGAAFWEGGFKHFFSTQPLDTAEAFKNQKIRTMKCTVLMEQLKRLGANPVFIDFHSLGKALHDGIVMGFEMPLTATASMELYHDISHVTLSHHGYIAHVLSFSKKSLQKLPFDIQKILIATAKEVTQW